MKILDIINSLDPAHGGPQHTTRCMSRIWRQMGHQADILTLDAPDAPYLEPGLPVHALGKIGARASRPGWSKNLDRYGYYPGAVQRAKQIVRDYDAVLVHGLWNYSTVLSRLALVGGSVPYYVFIHGMLDPWHKKAYPLKDRAKQVLWPLNEGALVNHADGVFFTTQIEMDLAQGSYRPYRAKARMVGYGCDGPHDAPEAQIAAFHMQFPQLRGRKFLIFLGRVHPKKGCDILLRAFARCLPELGDMDLVMAGPDQVGWQSDLMALAAELGIATRVHWTGMIAGDAKWGAFRAAEAFVLPSHGENFGIVVAEAMACSTPVIISDRVNLYHAVTHHDAGIVVPPDLDSTISALRQFAAMTPTQRRAMSTAARECYHANYDLDAAARRVLDAMTAKDTLREGPAQSMAQPA